MTATPSRQERTVDLADRLASIEHTFPLWRITRRPNGQWSATRAVAPTPAQAAAGLRWYVRRQTLDALAAAIAQQFDIAQTVA